MKKGFVSVICSLVLVSTGCRQAPPPETRERFVVLTTVGMLTDLTRQLAGEIVDVQGLIGEGVDPHLFSPSASDVRLIQAADAVIYVGHHLEGRLQRTFERRASQGHRVLAAAEQIPEDRLLLDEDEQIDPHLWMDVSLWAEVMLKVHESLTEWLPEHRDALERNLEALLARMAELDREVEEILAAIPPERRVLVTAHDAFGYLGRRHGLDVIGIQGLSTESEAGLRRVNELVDFLVKKEIPAVFVESTVADRQVLALVEGARSRGHQVRIGGELFSDAMGAPGTPEGTYIGMILHNARTIASALHPEGAR